MLLWPELAPYMLLNATAKARLGSAAPVLPAPTAEPACAAISPLQLGKAEPEAGQKGWSMDENQASGRTEWPKHKSYTGKSDDVFFKKPPRAQMTEKMKAVRPYRAHKLLSKIQSLCAPSIPQGPTNFQLTVP